MHLETVIIGSGLSSLSFIDKYLEKNKKIDVISPDKEFESEINKHNKHLFNDLPFQILKNLKKIKNYFGLNNIFVDKNSKILGALELGGLSNYWGLQIDGNILSDLNNLNKKSKNEIIVSFFEILKKFGFKGQFHYKNKNYVNDYRIDPFFEKLLKNKYKDLEAIKPILALSENNKLTADFYYKNFINKRKVKFHNFAVKEIHYEKKRVRIECVNSNGKLKTIFAKKIVLGCGTIITTKLILRFLKIRKEIKIKHHPRLVSVFFSKKKIKNYSIASSQLNIRSKNKNNSFIIDFRTGNITIVESLVRLKKFLLPFKQFIKIIQNYLVFSNILLDSKFSNLFMKFKYDKTYIYSKESSLQDYLKKIHKKIYKILKRESLIFTFSRSFFPGYGNDFHYFGTIPISKNNKCLSVNENCQLNGFPNIYIIDGSVFNFRVNKYPLGIVMANARRIANKIK